MVGVDNVEEGRLSLAVHIRKTCLEARIISKLSVKGETTSSTMSVNTEVLDMETPDDHKGDRKLKRVK